MIPQRFERRTYPYQEYTLPIKLRNLFIASHSMPTTNPLYAEQPLRLAIY